MAHNAHTLINLFVFSLIQLSFVTGTSAKNSERQREKQFFLPYGDFSRLKQKTQHIMAPRMLFSPELNFTTWLDSYTHDLFPEFQNWKTRWHFRSLSWKFKHTHIHTYFYFLVKHIAWRACLPSSVSVLLASFKPGSPVKPWILYGNTESRSWPQAGSSQHKSVVGR